MIVTDLDKLRIKSKPFKGTPEQLNYRFCMLEIELRESKIPGVGLSGVQIGITEQLAIIRTKKLSLNIYNSIILKGSGNIIKQEGCLSLPNQFMDVARKEKITIKNGDNKIIELKGYEARVAQHEIDHWHAILILDRRL